MSAVLFPLAIWPEGILQARIPANDNALRVEALERGALTFAATAPGSPSDGDVHIVAGSWGGFVTNDVVIYRDGNWYGFEPFMGWRKYCEDNQTLYVYDGGWSAASGGGGSGMQCIPIACSDENTLLTPGAAKVTFRMPYAFALSDVRASLTTAQPSGSIFTVDVNESGVSILSTKLTIDNTETTSTTAATPVVVSDPNLANDAEITIDIDQVGDAGARGLKVYLIGAA